MSTGENKQRGPGVNKQNNKAVVFDLLCKLDQPFRTNNDQLRKILKVHRNLTLSYEQMREILNSLYTEGKITIEKVGNLSLISTILPNDMMVFSQPLEHKNSNTPTYVWDWYKIITRDTKNEGVSMEDVARMIFYDAFNPEKFNPESAERQIRKAAQGYRKGRFTKRNGMPFERYIISDLSPFGKGYYTPIDKKEVDIDLKKKKDKALSYWHEYWYAVELASRDQQIRYVATKSEVAIHQAIKKEIGDSLT